MSSLDNPLWSSLTTLHRPLALGGGEALRYPADVAPFLAVAAEGADPGELGGETRYTIGPRPRAPAGYTVEDLGAIVQMVADPPLATADGPAVVELGPAHRTAILELAALVYPHYFRPRTPELGRYVGIFEGDTLVAMAGERMGFPGYREISAVCTHPRAVGRGFARRLLAVLANDIAASGATPFLHVSPSNARAAQLYEQNRFRARIAIRFAALRPA